MSNIGIPVAGGHSSRFGSNRALFSPNGETLIARAAQLLRLLCRQVLVSASHANAGAYTFLGLDIVEDLHSNCGPLGGLEAMLNRCPTPWLLVLTCNMSYDCVSRHICGSYGILIHDTHHDVNVEL